MYIKNLQRLMLQFASKVVPPGQPRGLEHRAGGCPGQLRLRDVRRGADQAGALPGGPPLRRGHAEKHVALGREHGQHRLGAGTAGRARLQYWQCGFAAVLLE